MVQELQRQRQSASFPETAPAANPVFFRTYSRRTAAGLRESWDEVCDRTLQGLVELGKLTQEEAALLDKMQRNMKSLPSGRWLWVGGTDWLKKSKNFSGAYNCTSTNLTDWKAFGLMMDLAMMGCGTGAIIEPQYINQLPPIRNRLNVTITGEVGRTPVEQRREFTETDIQGNTVTIHVGDSREGWVKSYQTLLELSTDERFSSTSLTDHTDDVQVIVDISDVRQSGETLKGFGGVANPVKLPGLYERCASILNKALGRQLTSVECCLLIGEAAVSIVAGNIRRCLPENALVHTETGLVPIAKVRIGDRVLTSKGFYPVTNFFTQGEQSLCRIQTQDGSFECTADHKVAVLTDVYGNYKMVKAKDLQPGDRLIFIPQAIPGTATELPEFRGKITGKTKPITIPALTPDVAYFIGYLHGDGSVSSDGSRVRFRVHENSPQILEHLIAVGREFGLDTHTLRTPEQCQTKAYELQFNSAALNQYLGLFKKPSQPLNVPDCILLGKADIRQAYLAGLADADGCHSQGVLVASVQQRFLQQVQALYASLGITTRLCSSICKRTGKWEGELVTVGETAYQSVNNCFDKYSLQHSHQKRQTPKSFKDHGFPQTMVRPIINSYQYHWSNNQEQMVLPTLRKYLPEATDLVPVKVVGVDFDVRTAPTYDIEVATVHEFVCEGILVSNSAGMRQFVAEDQQGATAKDNLWQQDTEGNWRIDPERDALRMANHTRVFHRKPTLEESIAAVQKQYYSGEGAIQWAGEAVARANIDLLNTPELKKDFLQAYEQGKAKAWIQERHPNIDDQELEHRLGRYGLNPCGEIIGTNFHCNLAEVHLNQLDPDNYKEQEEAFTAGALSVAALLNHQFQEPRYQYSRELDPIVGVSFTGLFDFFVHAFGVDWLRWWEQGRPETEEGLIFRRGEQKYLSKWREIVHQAVWEYCDKHGIKRPNRCTTVQPSGTKSLLTGASSGWHPPKAQRFIRRITFRKNDPVALACIDYGYNVIPSQSDKDENGNLLNDPFDPRCTEWLVEIPVAVSWADLPGADAIDVSKFSALAQLDFVMQVQKFYTRHNCFHRDTRFITRHGIFSFNDFEPGDKVEVINANGNWSIATVVCTSSPRTMYRITLQRASDIHEERLVQVVSTEDHRWKTFRRTGGRLVEEVTLTQDLTLEHKIPDILLSYLPNLDVSGIQHGIVLGDGTRRKDTGACQVYLCGEKRELGRYFPRRMERDDINQTRVTLLPSYYKELPSIDADESYLYGFIAGLLATDGNVCGTCISLSTGRAELVDWLKQVCPKLGLVISSIYIQKPSGYENSKGAYSVRFIRSSVHDSLILRDFHRQKLKPSCFSKKWKVLSVEKLDFQEYGWCVMEPETNQFALEHNILTYNTSATLELRSEEVEALGTRIYEAIQKDEGYISAALLARFDDIQTFPRLPFEPIDKETYERLSQEVKARRKTDDFCGALSRYDLGEMSEAGPSGCDSDKCMFPEQSPT